jgi:Tfp pilus assembly protein PilX
MKMGARPRHHESGAVLLLCLLLLTSLALLGLAAATDQVLQAKMSSNLVDGANAGQSVDSTLKWGQDWLFGLNGNNRPVACNSNCLPSDIVRPEGAFGDDFAYRDPDWWVQNAHAMGRDPVTKDWLLESPEAESERNYWLIEELHVEPEPSGLSLATEITYYRLTARASSPNNSTFTISESIVARPWGDASLTDALPKPTNDPGICFSLASEVPCGRLAWRQIH